MQGFIEANADVLQFYVVVGAFLLAVSWEAVLPRRAEGRAARTRWLHNIGLTVVNHVLAYWLEIALAAGIAWFAFSNELGLLNRIELPFPLQFLVTLLALELLFYAVHRLMHQVPVLWRLHQVHHADTEVDFSTTYRNHPGELVFVMAVSAPFILLLGPPVAAVTLYHSLRVVINILEHSNVLIPGSIDARLRWLLVTPDFHRLHHSSDRRFTDSNYGSMLPWYDYLFGTATRKTFDETTVMPVGLEYFRSADEMRIARLLTMPFRDRS